MAYFPDLLQVGSTFEPVPSAPLVGIYWPDSAGATVEAWEISGAGVVTTTPISSATAPFTPSGNTWLGESTTHPGERLSGRTVMLISGGIYIAWLSDDQESLAIWNLTAGTISEVELSPLANWAQVHLLAADGAFRVVYGYNAGGASLDGYKLVNVTTAGATDAYTYAFGVGDATLFQVVAFEETGFWSMSQALGSPSTSRGLEFTTWDGSKAGYESGADVDDNSAFDQANSVPIVVTGRAYPQTALCWSLTGSVTGVPSEVRDNDPSPHSIEGAADADLGGRGSADGAQVAQHISGNSVAVAVWRYVGTGDATDYVVYHPLDDSAFTNQPATEVLARASDSARAHVVLLGDYEPTFSV